MAHFQSATLTENGNWEDSLPSLFQQFHNEYPDVIIAYETFKCHRNRLVKRFMETGSVTKRNANQAPSVLTEDRVDDIRQRMDSLFSSRIRSPTSLWMKALESIAPEVSVAYLRLSDTRSVTWRTAVSSWIGLSIAVIGPILVESWWNWATSFIITISRTSGCPLYWNIVGSTVALYTAMSLTGPVAMLRGGRWRI
ncbi:hypothetical protein Trydic_g7758 [Trypoxylus dichotomus]